MAGKFVLKMANNDHFMFNLHVNNGEIVLTSEMYTTKAAAEKGIASVRENAGKAERFEKLVAKNGKPYFTLKAANHQIIGTSEMYNSESARDNGIESVKKNAPTATIEDRCAAAASTR